MIQIEDDVRIEKLKKQMGAKTKIDVVRTALRLLEADISKSERIKRWQKSAQIIGKSGLAVLQEFQFGSRFKKLP
jgi:hypothetical protein